MNTRKIPPSFSILFTKSQYIQMFLSKALPYVLKPILSGESLLHIVPRHLTHTRGFWSIIFVPRQWKKSSSRSHVKSSQETLPLMALAFWKTSWPFESPGPLCTSWLSANHAVSHKLPNNICFQSLCPYSLMFSSFFLHFCYLEFDLSV